MKTRELEGLRADDLVVQSPGHLHPSPRPLALSTARGDTTFHYVRPGPRAGGGRARRTTCPRRSFARRPAREGSTDPRACVWIVTCGGLCPGLNNVVRALVMETLPRYGVPGHHGLPLFRDRAGRRGGADPAGARPGQRHPQARRELPRTVARRLEPKRDGRQAGGGATSRCSSPSGSDGTQRGAHAAAEAKRAVGVAVVGIPKTIDNDVAFVDKDLRLRHRGGGGPPCRRRPQL